MIRIAAVGDLHVGLDSADVLAAEFRLLRAHADVLLLAGDLTRVGDPDEAAILAEALVNLELPVLVVLGNHDYHCGQEKEVVAVLEAAGVQILEARLWSWNSTDFGEAEMKALPEAPTNPPRRRWNAVPGQA